MWTLEKWWQKLVYVVGWIYASVMIVAFVVGFIDGFIEGIK